MIKKILFILLINFSIGETLNAQNWCAPNSVWHFNYYSQFNGPGYAQLSYAGTVTINSQSCQQINYYRAYYHPTSIGANTGYTTSSTGSPYYTYENNNIVYIYNQMTSHFDTLYNYGANIGGSWYMPARYNNPPMPTCARVLATVLDTGHTFISNINLKWLKISLQASPGQIIDTIYQRFGLLNSYFYNFDWCSQKLDYTEGGALRCFSDNQLNNFNRSTKACDFIVSAVAIKENRLNPNLKIYPNPISSILTIELNDTFEKPLDITLSDALGRTVKQISVSATAKIDLSDVENGIYFLQVFEDGRLVASEKIVKE